jgi:hypothetical protein
LDVIRIELNEEIIENPINADELPNSLCIFDNIDSLVNLKIKKQIKMLRDQLLQKGRHQNISVICTSHQITNYLDTRVTLNDSQFITLFPRAMAKRNIQYVLKSYFGMDNDKIEKAINLPTRFLTVHKE